MASGGRTGRRRGSSTTRGEILAAARRVFAECGLEGATVRGIAAEAGVDPALVLRFYGSKQRVFQEAVGWPFPPAEAIAALVDGDRAELGLRLARFVVAVWEGPAGERVVALLRAAAASKEAADTLGGFLDAGLIRPAAEALGAETPVIRTALVNAQLLGVMYARYVLRAGPLATATPEELVAALAPELQALLLPEA